MRPWIVQRTPGRQLDWESRQRIAAESEEIVKRSAPLEAHVSRPANSLMAGSVQLLDQNRLSAASTMEVHRTHERHFSQHWHRAGGITALDRQLHGLGLLGGLGYVLLQYIVCWLTTDFAECEDDGTTHI